MANVEFDLCQDNVFCDFFQRCLILELLMHLIGYKIDDPSLGEVIVYLIVVNAIVLLPNLHMALYPLATKQNNCESTNNI